MLDGTVNCLWKELGKNGAQRARYANKSQVEKEETQRQAKEWTVKLRVRRTDASTSKNHGRNRGRSNGQTWIECCAECQLEEGWKRGRNRLKKIVKCIRNYNSALAFASVGATTSLTPGNGPYCFRIHGQVYRNTSALAIKHHVEKSSYAQLYFIEAEQAIKVKVFYEVKRACDRN